VLRIDRGAVGLRAVKQSDFELDIGFAGALGSNAGEAAARQGMPVLGTLLEFGPRARLKLGNDPGGGQWGLELPLRGVFDATDRFAARGFAFEPRVQWSPPALAGWRVGASVGALLGDRQLAGTFSWRGTRLCDGSATRLRCQGRILFVTTGLRSPC
jgi:hypothetical protein